MFNSTYASKSTSELSLLNATVSSLAKTINDVLSFAYTQIYSGGDPSLRLELLTSPLAVAEELVKLHKAGLAPVEVTVPRALSAMGASQPQIDHALQLAQVAQSKTEARSDERDSDAKRRRDFEYDSNAKRLKLDAERRAATAELEELQTKRQRETSAQEEEGEEEEDEEEEEEDATQKKRRKSGDK